LKFKKWQRLSRFLLKLSEKDTPAIWELYPASGKTTPVFGKNLTYPYTDILYLVKLFLDTSGFLLAYVNQKTEFDNFISREF
jgi:hypothetical protein